MGDKEDYGGRRCYSSQVHNYKIKENVKNA